MELGEGLKKILLVGIGTAAVTAEKSKEILDELVKKGELTVEQGKVLNQELKHNIKSTVKTAADSVKESAARKERSGRAESNDFQTDTGAAGSCESTDREHAG